MLIRPHGFTAVLKYIFFNCTVLHSKNQFNYTNRISVPTKIKLSLQAYIQHVGAGAPVYFASVLE